MIAMLWAVVAHADELSVNAKVSQVVVYLDRARVTREVTVEVPAGRSDLVFAQLPVDVIPASLSAEGEGTAGATLTGIDFRPQTGVVDLDEKIRALKQARRVEEEAIRLQTDTLQRIQADISFVQGLSPKAPPTLQPGLFLANDAASQLSAVAKGIGNDLLVLFRDQRTAELSVRSHQQELDRIDRELAVLGQGGGDSTRVAVGVDANRAGRVTVRLSYVVTGAGWTPHWDARFRPADGKVQLDLSGEVRQTTGESWDDVALTLSTARTDQSTAPPELAPFYLSEGYSNNTPGGMVESESTTAVEFTSSFSENIPTDGASHRVFVNTLLLSADVIHQVVARRVEAAWLTARAKNTADFALLPGPMSSYLGTAYIGEGYLAATAPGAQVDLSFGVDDRVRVKRTRMADVSTEAHALQNRDRRHYGWKTAITNRTGKAIQLRVTDQIPASNEAIFQVEATATPTVTIPTTGVFTWEMTLENGKSQDFVIGYDVSWPSGTMPILME